MDTNPDKQTIMEIAAAASLMGLSVETLRKRLQRGRVNGFKSADGSWRVVLDNEVVRRSVGEETAGLLSEQRQIGSRLDALAQSIDRLDERLSELTELVDRLDRRLERFPSLMALLELKADEPGLGDQLQEQLKPVMLALYEVVKAIRQH